MQCPKSYSRILLRTESEMDTHDFVVNISLLIYVVDVNKSDVWV